VKDGGSHYPVHGSYFIVHRSTERGADMMKKDWLKFGALVLFLISGVMFYQVAQAQQSLPKHPTAPGDGKNLVVQLCDGETNLAVPGVDPNARLTPEQAQAVSNQLMSRWLSKKDKATADAWMKEATVSAQTQAPANHSQKSKKPIDKQGTSRLDKAAGNGKERKQVVDFSARDYSIWDKELAKEIEYGNQLFHSDQLIGSTNGIACAMCHPNGSNTHPETYPKFQIQLKRVALLRDMINWCIENPARGPRLEADDPKMRALEAYIMAQRKGTAMQPGKH
jgi:thiosulfate dehydrogenase